MKLVIQHKNAMRAGLDAPLETTPALGRRAVRQLSNSNGGPEALTAAIDKINHSFSVA